MENEAEMEIDKDMIIKSFASVTLPALQDHQMGEYGFFGELFGAIGSDTKAGETFELHPFAVIRLPVVAKEETVYLGTPIYMIKPSYEGGYPVAHDDHGYATTDGTGRTMIGMTVSRSSERDQYGLLSLDVLIYPHSA